MLESGWDKEGMEVKFDTASEIEILKRIRATIGEEDKKDKKDKKQVLLKRSLQIAASLALIATLLFVYRWNVSNQGSEIAMVVKEAAFGKVEKVILADGSIVWLNSGSSISYPNEFMENKRVVNLKGEAFFEVSHDKKRPFFVKSGAFSTKVLGTSFNVTAFSEGPYTVTVATGKVKVKHENEFILLTRNQQGHYNAHYKKFTAKQVNSKELSDWRFGILHLNGKLSEALKNVERKYGVKVVFDDPQLQAYEIAATYKNESLTNVLKSIEFSMGVKISLKENIVKISKHSK